MANNLEIDINNVIGKLHTVAVENAKKKVGNWFLDLFRDDISKMMVNTGILKADTDEPQFAGPGKTYEIIFKRKGVFNLDRCKDFLQEYMKWFAGEKNFNIKKYTVKTVLAKKNNTRYFKFEYKVVVKKIAEKKKLFGGKKLKENDLVEILLQETGNNTPTITNSKENNIWMNINPFGVK